MNVLAPSQRINAPYYPHALSGIPQRDSFPPPRFTANGRMLSASQAAGENSSFDLDFVNKSSEKRSSLASSAGIAAWVKEVSLEMTDEVKESPRRPQSPPRTPTRRTPSLGGGVPRKRLASQTHARNRSTVINVPLTPWWKVPPGSDAHKGLFDIAEDVSSDSEESEIKELSLPPPLLGLEVKAPRPRYAHTYLLGDDLSMTTPPLSPSLSTSSPSSTSSSLISLSPCPSDMTSSPLSSPSVSRTCSPNLTVPAASPRRHRRRLSGLDDIPEE